MPEVEFAGADLHGELQGVAARVSLNQPLSTDRATSGPYSKLPTDHTS